MATVQPRALIVGAAGQDGTLLADLLFGRGYQVFGIIHRAPARDQRIRCARLSLTDAGAVSGLIADVQPNQIYYLAAHHHSAEAIERTDDAEILGESLRVNVEGLGAVLEGMSRHCPEARLFYAASAHVFGHAQDDPQDEDTPFAPASAYAISKVAAMQWCRHYRQRGFHVSAGILYNHESALRPAGFLTHKILAGVAQARHDPAAKLHVGSLSARADWGFAPDYVDAMRRIVECAVPDDYVIATGELHSVEDYVRHAYAAGGLDWQDHVIETDALTGKRTLPLRGNSDRLQRATGWHPSVSFEQMVRRLVQDTLSSASSTATCAR